MTHCALLLQRKKTLLVEYRQLRKANAFVDRRFGEEDEGLTPEERAIARFQKQRMAQSAGVCHEINRGSMTSCQGDKCLISNAACRGW